MRNQNILSQIWKTETLTSHTLQMWGTLHTQLYLVRVRQRKSQRDLCGYEIHYGFTVAHVIMEAEICLQAGELGKQGYNSIRVQRPETQELRCPRQEKVAVPAQEGTDMPFICLWVLSGAQHFRWPPAARGGWICFPHSTGSNANTVRHARKCFTSSLCIPKPRLTLKLTITWCKGNTWS